MSTSVSSVISHFPSAQNGFSTTLATTVASGATTVPLNSVAGYSNGEVAVMVVDPTDVAKKQTFTGTIDTAGIQLTSVVWTAGTNQTHTGGSTVVDYATATHVSMMTKGLLVEHAQAGTHGAITTTSISNAGTTTLTGALTIKSYDGWINTADTWVYASATTFTIAGVDRTTQLSVGTKIKLTQTTAKYFYVTASSFSTNTTVTITGGSDYTLANAAITSPALSYDSNPQGHPFWFNFTPSTTTGWSATPTTSGTRFCIKGRECTYRYIVTGTSNATSVQISLPVATAASATTGTFNFEGVLGLAQDNGTVQSTAHRQVIDPSTSTTLITCYHDMATTAWTNSGAKSVRGTAVYEI